MGLLKAILDAIHGEDNRIAGSAITRTISQVSDTETTEIVVESTIGFGENTDGLSDAKLLINGEVIGATGRLTGPSTYKFTGLTRGVASSQVQTHPPGSLVYDLARNSSALDLVRRGFFVATAIAEDLGVVGRNVGLHRCPGMSEEEWRRIIQAVAYLPKNTVQAFEKTLEAYFDDTTSWTVVERLASDPWKVFVRTAVAPVNQLRGKFVLNGGEPALTLGVNTVDTLYPINNVLGVYDDNATTRAGFREGQTNYFSGGGSFLGNTVTLGSSPGAAGTPVIVDYGAFAAHYLAPDTPSFTLDDGDYYAYLTDSLQTVRCLLDQVRTAGVKVEVGLML